MSQSINVDYLIVGLGIAGAALAYRLLQAGKNIFVIDKGTPETSSRIAAGLINPVTGRKYVKSWMIETLLKEANVFYPEFEQAQGVRICRQMDIVRLLKDPREEERWMMRTADPVYQNYLSNVKRGGVVDGIFKEPSPYGIVKGGMRISFPVLLDALRSKLIKAGKYRSEIFDYQSISGEGSMYRYKGLIAREIIFCEGAGMRKNPFFNQLPMSDNKGEVLLLRSGSYPENLMVKKKHFTIPLENGLIWYGSANSWKDTEPGPSKRAYQELKRDLESDYRLNFEIADHLAAFRPAVVDRRPLLGSHPHQQRMHILNGFGTKGASLAPYFSKIMCSYLLEGTELPKDVDINRFDVWDA